MFSGDVYNRDGRFHEKGDSKAIKTATGLMPFRSFAGIISNLTSGKDSQ